MSFDVLIVGSGAGGGMTAYQLCQAGLKVGLIERGKKFNPQKDYIQNYPDWETRHDPLNDAKHREQTIDQTYLSPITDNPTQTKHRRFPFNYHRVHGLGGSTLHYQGEAHRFAEHAFTTQSTFGWGLDWPISYADLAAYYQQAEKLLGVAGETGNPFKTDREPFPTPAHPLSVKGQILAASARALGMTLLPNTLALPSKSIDNRTPCQHSGGCNYGCVFGAKSSVDQAIIPKAKETGNLTILTETRVTKLSIDIDGKVNGVYALQNGQHTQIGANIIILAGGAVETPRLLLHSKNEHHPDGVGNQHDQVGRYFMETIVSRLPIMLSNTTKVFRGPPIEARIWDFCYPEDNKTNGFVLGITGYLTRQTGPVSHAVFTKGIGKEHKRKVRESFGRQLNLISIAEQEPRATNRITLSDAKDDKGIPRVKINCTYSDQDRHTVIIMNEKLSAWANATPVDFIGQTHDSRRASSATHVAGSCRMGNDPNTSVVDAWGKIHGLDNVYITDGSVMPTQGAGDSPSLTIQALALRTADKIAQGNAK